MSDSAKEKKYIMLPISVLSAPEKSPADVTQEEQATWLPIIKALSVWRLAQRLSESEGSRDDLGTIYDDGAVQAMADRQYDNMTAADWRAYFGDDDGDVTSQQLLASLTVHGINIADFMPKGFNITKMSNAMATLESKLMHPHGRKYARMRSDIFDDASNGLFTWREFAVLTAIYASLSDKKIMARKLYYEQLAAMASGYCGQHQAENAGVPADRFLTRKQIRTTIDSLWRRGLFQKVPAGRGMWFSIRRSMTEAGLVRYAAAAEADAKRKSAAALRSELKHQKAVIQEGHQHGHLSEKQDTTDGQQGGHHGGHHAGHHHGHLSEKLSSDKPFSDKPFSEKHSGRHRQKPPTPSGSELKTDVPSSLKTAEPECAEAQTISEPNEATTLAVHHEQADATLTVSLAHDMAQSRQRDSAAFLATQPDDRRKELLALQRFDQQRRRELNED